MTETKKAALIEQPKEISPKSIIALDKEIEKLARLFDGKVVTLIRLAGYSSHNKAATDSEKYQSAKVPIDPKWNGRDFVTRPLEELFQWIDKGGWLGLVVPTGYIVVDIDDHIEGNIALSLLQTQRIRHHSIQTPNGYQFIFRDAETVSKQSVKMLSDAGFIVDYRLPNKGQIVLPLEGLTPGRQWIHLDQTVEVMPTWFNGVKNTSKEERPFTLPIAEGSRNETLFAHGCRLRQMGRTKDVITETILLVGQHLCNPPMDTSELATIAESVQRYRSPNGPTPPKEAPDLKWETPSPIGIQSMPPFPVTLFPSKIKQLIEAVTVETQTPIDASAMCALSVLSTAQAKNFLVEVPWREKNNLYTMVIMPPGEKKSVVHRMLASVIFEYEKEQMKSMHTDVVKAQAEVRAKNRALEELEKKYAKNVDPSLLDQIKSLTEEISRQEQVSFPRYVTADVTQEKLVGLLNENKGKMAILSAEGGLFEIIAGRYTNGKANMDIFLNGYSGDHTMVDRMGRSESIADPTLTIGLFVQPDILQSVPKGFEKRGLLGRFLFSLPESYVGRRVMAPERVRPELFEQYNELIKTLLNFKPTSPIGLRLDRNAEELFHRFRQHIEDRFLPGADLSSDAMKAWGNKFPGHLLRVASLIHIAHEAERLGTDFTEDNVSKTISLRVIEEVVHQSEYFIHHTKAAFNIMNVDDGLEDARYVLSRIMEHQEQQYSHDSLKRLVHNKLKTADDYNDAFNILEEYGYLRSTSTNDNGKGRPGSIYHVNPLLFPNTNEIKTS